MGDLELTADGGAPIDEAARMLRYGIRITADSADRHATGILVVNVDIHDIFASESSERDGQNTTSNLGIGISVDILDRAATLTDLVIDSVTVTTTGFTGMRLFGNGSGSETHSWIAGLRITNSVLTNIGGPGIVPGRCHNGLVRNVITNVTGSSSDPRMHMRGSGLWTWTTEDFLVEHCRFLHARGKADSCGSHIDFNCRNVVFQHNLSYDNEGGFVEILGNDHNCVYRYNVSVNDGFRVKGEGGAHQAGKILWTSGHTGRNQQKHGPYNNYVYNNTVVVRGDLTANFSISPTIDGLLVANNVFFIEGSTANVAGDQDQRRPIRRQI